MAASSNPAQPSVALDRRTVLVAGALGVGLTALAVTVTGFGGFSRHPSLAAAARGTIVAAPIAVGLYAWRCPPYQRFGRMLFLVGGGWSLTALAGSTNAVLYSTGRVAGWLVEVGFVWLVLAYPTGRLERRRDRDLLTAFAIVVLLGYVPTALLGNGYPTPSPWSECVEGCPANAFQLVTHEPPFVAHGLPQVREALTMLIFLGVAVLLAGRVRSATRLMRLALTPVLAIAVTRLAVYVVAFALRGIDADEPGLGALAWTIALLVPAMAIAFLIGLVRWQLFAAGALQRLAPELHAHPDDEHLGTVLARTLRDPSLRLAFWTGEPTGAWIDAAGERFDMGTVEPGRLVTTIYDGDQRVAAIVHDAALADQPEFVGAVGNLAAIALDNHRLLAKVRSSLREVQESRARILASADEERRRIERDLHDGAQQRLVALRIKLELAEELLPEDARKGRELLQEIGDETLEALEDVRSLAHGVYPALLTQRGLAEALRDAVLRSPVPVRLDAGGIGRYPPEVESAVYFCCLEAMQNGAKHAHGARLIAIGLTDDGQLHFQISDDGAGFDTVSTTPGTGIANMHDRLAAVGGEVTIRSHAGMGTRVVGVVPGHGLPRP